MNFNNLDELNKRLDYDNLFVDKNARGKYQLWKFVDDDDLELILGNVSQQTCSTAIIRYKMGNCLQSYYLKEVPLIVDEARKSPSHKVTLVENGITILPYSNRVGILLYDDGFARRGNIICYDPWLTRHWVKLTPLDRMVQLACM